MSTPINTPRWICKTCGWIYDENKGDPDSGLAPGTRFEDIPDDWSCPLCGVTKADFITLEEYAAQGRRRGIQRLGVCCRVRATLELCGECGDGVVRLGGCRH